MIILYALGSDLFKMKIINVSTKTIIITLGNMYNK